MRSRKVIIGVGNPWRRDDGVGWAVVEAAGRRIGRAADIVRSDGEPSRLLDAWADRELAVVVDALRSGALPGTIHCSAEESATPRGSTAMGSHALGLTHAISLGRALERVPTRLYLVAIEVDDTASGHGLSPAVAAAVTRAAEMIAAVILRPDGTVAETSWPYPPDAVRT